MKKVIISTGTSRTLIEEAIHAARLVNNPTGKAVVAAILALEPGTATAKAVQQLVFSKKSGSATELKPIQEMLNSLCGIYVVEKVTFPVKEKKEDVYLVLADNYTAVITPLMAVGQRLRNFREDSQKTTENVSPKKRDV